jgi:ABC-type sugar transport system ATPase subunit
MIYVTHDQVEAMTLADRIVVLRAGRIEQVGTPLDVYNRPANLFVAGFIGSPRMNLLPARVTAFEQVAVGSDSRPISVPMTDNAPPGADCTLGARPEHIDVVGEAEADLVITLELVEQLGGETYLYGSAPGLPPLTVRQEGQARYDRNQRLGLRLKRDALHLFDADGNAIRR